MQSAYRLGALALILVAWIGISLKDALSIGDAVSGEELTFFDQEITGSIGRAATDSLLPLNDEQRSWIFLGVINLPDLADVELALHQLAGALPDAVTLQELPAMVTSRIPLVKDYRFVKLDDRILLVRPGDRVVVAEIPRYRVWQ
jgi:hypothetical protein